MPRIPKTLPAQLRQYYKAAPRPASAYGNDVFNFAADRLGRRNRAMQDLEDLDRYAMEQQARGRYRPDELNALARQIEADRMLSEMQFNEYFNPRYAAAEKRRAAVNSNIRDLANYQRGYANLQRRLFGDAGITGEDYYLPKLKPWLAPSEKPFEEMSEPDLAEFIEDTGSWPDPMEYERVQMPYQENEDLLEEMIPSDEGPFYSRSGWEGIHKAIDKWEKLNSRPYFPPNRFKTNYEEWRESLGNKRYR